MTPILFDENETQFNTFGIGFLGDAISCTVTEERNGIYELEMQYPMDGVLFGELKENRIIFAKPSEKFGPQAFQIYKVTEPMDVVTVYAEHIRYRLNFIPVAPITAESCAKAFEELKKNSLVANPFNFYTDKNIEKIYTTGEPKSASNILGGTEGSILQEFQGEYEFDNWDVRLLTHRGKDTGVTLRYGKNITDFEQEKDLTNTVTGVLPYWKNEEHLVIGDITEVSPGNAPRRIETVDITSELTSDTEGYIPTKAEVTQAGAAALENKSYIGVPSVNLRISFVALWQTDEYKDIAPLEKVNLCDTVKVFYEPLGVEVSAKVIKTVYDVLLERYEEIEIGDKATSLSEKIVSQSKEITNVKTRIEKTFDTITIAVENGAKSSVIKLSGDGIQTQAQEIKFTGGVVFEDNLIDNKTVISGGNIQTGRLYAHGQNGYTLIDTDTGTIEWDMGNSTLTEDGDFVSHGEWSTGIIGGNIYSASGDDVDDENYDAAIEMHNQFRNVSGYVTRIYNDHIIIDGDLHVPNPDYIEGGTQTEYFNTVENGAYVGSDSYENPIGYTEISDVTRGLSFETKNNVVSDLSAARDYNDAVRNLSFSQQSVVTGVSIKENYNDYVRNLQFTEKENVVSNLTFTRDYSDVVRNLKFTYGSINGQTVITGATWYTFDPITSASWSKDTILKSASWSNVPAVTGLTLNNASVLSGANWGNFNPVTGLNWANNTILQSANWENRTFSYASSNKYRRAINGACT